MPSQKIGADAERVACKEKQVPTVDNVGSAKFSTAFSGRASILARSCYHRFLFFHAGRMMLYLRFFQSAVFPKVACSKMYFKRQRMG